MKKTVLLLILLIFVSRIFAQKDLVPSWYQITRGAQVAIIQGTSNDGLDSNSWDVKSYREGEILLAYAYLNDVYYCFDPEGRMVKVKGKTGLKKIMIPGKPGYFEKEYTVNDKITLYGKQAIWITSMDLKTKRAIILLKDGTKTGVEITGLKLYTKWFDFLSVGRPFIVAKP
jgi:hypothetical protein